MAERSCADCIHFAAPIYDWQKSGKCVARGIKCNETYPACPKFKERKEEQWQQLKLSI